MSSNYLRAPGAGIYRTSNQRKANYRFWHGAAGPACTNLAFPDKQSRPHRHKTQRLEKLAAI